MIRGNIEKFGRKEIVNINVIRHDCVLDDFNSNDNNEIYNY